MTRGFLYSQIVLLNSGGSSKEATFSTLREIRITLLGKCLQGGTYDQSPTHIQKLTW